MSVSALGSNTLLSTNSLARRKDVITEIINVTLQLRRKLCPPEQIPPFLEAYDKGLSLKEALEQFETLWKTHNKEAIS